MKDLFINYWTLLSNKTFEISSYYGVDPMIFGLIYIGTIPLLGLSISWIIRGIQKKKSVVIPIFSTVLCYTGAYIYLIIAGQNIPVWIYFALAGIIGFAGYQFHRKVACKLSEVKRGEEFNRGPGEIIRR